MDYLGNIKKQYWISFFHSLIPAYVIERLFWQQRGMNVQMVVYTEIIYALTVVIFELPSGILADRFGRKRLITICNALAAVELLLLLFAHHFWQFAFAIFLSGIGKAFSSGSGNALLYDSLLPVNKQGDFEKILGRLSAVDFISSLIAALSGSVLANFFHLEFNYIVSIASMTAAFVVTMTLKEPPGITRPESDLAGMRPYAKQALTVFLKQPLVFVYCLTGAVLGACITYLDEFWQILLDNIGVPVLFFGIVSAIVMAFRIPGNLFAYKLKERLSYRRIFSCAIAVNVLSYIAIYFTRNLLCLIPMIAVSLVAGIIDPLAGGYLHHHTESHIRATVESFSSLGLRLTCILVGLFFGHISTGSSIFAGFAFLGIFCFAYWIFFQIWHYRRTA
ncbi:MFS family permease [Anaerotaenia torta]|uniref:MFS transporter n=1 Tax=Anaerotaenia torta TaxID=433293 RepID=UPI003D248CD8